jgi:hypothetical protein
MLSPSYSPWFHHLNNIWWGVQNMKLLITQFSPLPVISSLLGPNILPSTLFLNTLRLRFSLNLSNQVSHPYKTTGQKCSSLYLNLYIFG